MSPPAPVAVVAQPRVRAVPVEITVFTRDIDDTRRRHPQAARVVCARELVRDQILPEIERLDLLILGGGGILFDAEARIYLREVTLAFEKSVPVMVTTAMLSLLARGSDSARRLPTPRCRLVQGCGIAVPAATTVGPDVRQWPACGLQAIGAAQ